MRNLLKLAFERLMCHLGRPSEQSQYAFMYNKLIPEVYEQYPEIRKEKDMFDIGAILAMKLMKSEIPVSKTIVKEAMDDILSNAGDSLPMNLPSNPLAILRNKDVYLEIDVTVFQRDMTYWNIIGGILTSIIENGRKKLYDMVMEKPYDHNIMEHYTTFLDWEVKMTRSIRMMM